MGASDQLIHDLSVVIQSGGAASIQIIGISAAVGLEDVYHIPVIQAAVIAGISHKQHIVVRLYHADGGSWIIFGGFAPCRLGFAIPDQDRPEIVGVLHACPEKVLPHQSLTGRVNGPVLFDSHDTVAGHIIAVNFTVFDTHPQR